MKNYEMYKTPTEKAKAFMSSNSPRVTETDDLFHDIIKCLEWLEEDAHELELCPFCKTGATLYQRNSSFYVQCNECGARTAIHSNKDAAIKNWNKRA